MTKEDLEQFKKVMIQVFNDGCEQVLFERFEELEEKIKESEESVKNELREEFKRGQKSLSNRLEEMEVDISGIKKDMSQMNQKMDQVVGKNEDYGRRLDKVEIIAKA